MDDWKVTPGFQLVTHADGTYSAIRGSVLVTERIADGFERMVVVESLEAAMARGWIVEVVS